MCPIYWLHERNKKYTNCDFKDIYVVMLMYNLIEYRDNYSKTLESLWQYYRDKPALADGTIVDFPTSNDNSASFIFKKDTKGTKNVEIMVPL